MLTQMSTSPTAQGFRSVFEQPTLTLAEITWRWTSGATASVLFFFGLFEYLNTLPVTNGDLLFLRTRQPYLVGEAIAHILHGSLSRAVLAGLLAILMLGLLWIVAGSVGRIATVRGLLDHFRGDTAGDISAHPEPRNSGIRALVRLNFLRGTLALAAVFGFVGATILSGFVSTDANPRPGLAFLLFLPLAAMICLVWWVLNWFLSLAGMFAARNGGDAADAISHAADFCREHTGAVFAVSAWTGLMHMVALVGAATLASLPLGFISIVRLRLAALGVALVSLSYFALADWLYIARLAGYVCIAEMPEVLVGPPVLQSVPPGGLPVTDAPVQTSIDRDESILSDVPNLAPEF